MTRFEEFIEKFGKWSVSKNCEIRDLPLISDIEKFMNKKEITKLLHKSMDYKLILIKWLDSKGITNKWEYLEDIEPLPPCICTSIGFLIDETDQYKTIAQSFNKGQIIGRITIPCCSIQDIKEIGT